jgi:hypothetical protein
MKRILTLVLLFAAPMFAQSFPHPSTEVTWNASPNGVAYNVYRFPCTSAGVCDTSAPVKLNAAPVLVLTYTDATVVLGNNYGYWITALSSLGDESVPSNTASVIFRTDPPTNAQAKKH